MKTKNSKAFTLVEVLVVVIVLGILAKLTVPKLVRVLETRRTTEAEEVLTSVRTEQEKRCVAGQFYAQKMSEIPALAYLENKQGGHYTYEAKKSYVVASTDNYSLKMPYKTGQIYCDGENCDKLNKNYPLWTKEVEAAVAIDECSGESSTGAECIDRPGACCSFDPVTKQPRSEGYTWSFDHDKCVECKFMVDDPTYCTGDPEHVAIVGGDKCSCLICEESSGIKVDPTSRKTCVCDWAKIPPQPGQLKIDHSKYQGNRFCKYAPCGGDFTSEDGKSCSRNLCQETKESCNAQQMEFVDDTDTQNKEIEGSMFSFSTYTCGCKPCEEPFEYSPASQSCTCNKAKQLEMCLADDRPIASDCGCGAKCGSNYFLNTEGKCTCDPEKASDEVCAAQNKIFDKQNCKCLTCSEKYLAYNKQYVDNFDEDGTWVGCVPACKDQYKEPAGGCGENRVWKENDCACSDCQNEVACDTANGEFWDSGVCACQVCDQTCDESKGYRLNATDCSCSCPAGAPSFSTCKNRRQWRDGCVCKTCEEAGYPAGYETKTGYADDCKATSCQFTEHDCFLQDKKLVKGDTPDCYCGSCEDYYKAEGLTYYNNPKLTGEGQCNSCPEEEVSPF